jgi:hypothetical protein
VAHRGVQTIRGVRENRRGDRRGGFTSLAFERRVSFRQFDKEAEIEEPSRYRQIGSLDRR